MEPQAAKLRDRARRLRHNQTEAEHRLWARLRARQLCDAKFRRQHPIGPFIADFCCLERRLVIELDGGKGEGEPIDFAGSTVQGGEVRK